jgi:glycosyltransferase involved in cell wall biosynthesis
VGQVAVVLPVRNASRLLPECLATVVPQADAAGAEVIVVDDGSTDDSVSVAERRGTRVIRRSEHQGPYVARNAGWMSTEADVVVFTDARCRARPGWLDRLTAVAASSEVAVAGGDTIVRDGQGLARHYSHWRQHLLTSASMAGHFMPYFPTCNLAVRRVVLQALEGFRPLQSGGDVDFCWRAQVGGFGEARVADDAEMEWEPRDSVRAVVSQWRKYGTNNPLLYASFAGDGCTVPPPPPLLRQALHDARALMVGAVRRHPPGPSIDGMHRLCQLVYWRAYRRSYVALTPAFPAQTPTGGQ